MAATPVTASATLQIDQEAEPYRADEEQHYVIWLKRYYVNEVRVTKEEFVKRVFEVTGQRLEDF